MEGIPFVPNSDHLTIKIPLIHTFLITITQRKLIHPFLWFHGNLTVL